MSSRVRCRPLRTLVDSRAGSFSSRKRTTLARNASSSGVKFRFMTALLSIDFEEPGGAHAPGHAHRDDGVLDAAPPSFDEDVPDEPRARHPERMADRNRAA